MTSDFYDLVAFGMRGSFAGIVDYEVQIAGALIGTVWKRGPKWYARAVPTHATKRQGPFKTRRAAIASLTDTKPRGHY